jgi:hypothetical protein
VLDVWEDISQEEAVKELMEKVWSHPVLHLDVQDAVVTAMQQLSTLIVF